MDITRNNTSEKAGQLPPPPGVTPDFDNPSDAGWTLNIVGVTICNALVTIFFLLRFYVRIFINHRIILADWACLVSWVLIILYSVTIYVMAHYGLGYHAWEVTIADYSQVLKWLYASSIIYIPAAWFTKVTILLMIARVFAVEAKVSHGIHIFIWVLLFAYTPIQTIKTIICVPIRAYWDPSLPDSRCLNQRKVFISDLCLAVVADLVILLVPTVLTWRLSLPLRKKIKIILMLGAGGAATAVTIFRLVKVILFLDSDDITADFVVLDLTTIIELTVGLVCACLPSANMLFEHRLGQRERSKRSNEPRTGRFSRSSRTSEPPSNWWDSLARKAGITTTTSAAAGKDTTTNTTQAMTEVPVGGCGSQLTGQMMTFDLELAMFTGQSLEAVTRNESEEAVNASPPSGGISTVDGRREGWLAPKEDGDTDCEGGVQNGAGSGLVRYWSTIWDGTHTDIPQ